MCQGTGGRKVDTEISGAESGQRQVHTAEPTFGYVMLRMVAPTSAT